MQLNSDDCSYKLQSNYQLPMIVLCDCVFAITYSIIRSHTRIRFKVERTLNPLYSQAPSFIPSSSHIFTSQISTELHINFTEHHININDQQHGSHHITWNTISSTHFTSVQPHLFPSVQPQYNFRMSAVILIR